MNLRTIVAKILKEDAPIGGTQPTPQPSAATYDVLKDFQEFEKSISDATIAAKKQLETTLKEKLANKKIKINASVGDANQFDKDYVINVKNVSIASREDEYSIVIQDTNGKNYYLNVDFQITIVGDSAAGDRSKQSMQGGNSNQMQKTPQDKNTGSPRSVGGISYPQTMGMSSNNPNTISR